jgi:microcompartment protein CcmL/EutN
MGIGGKGLVVMTGEVSQVESALSQGTALARERGRHVKSVVIPNPDPRFAEFIMDPQNPFSDFLI